MSLVAHGDTYGDYCAIVEEFTLYKKSTLLYCFHFLGKDLLCLHLQRHHRSVYATCLLEIITLCENTCES